MHHLWINGWHAGMDGVGQGVYAQRLLAGLARHARSLPYKATIIAPEQNAEKLAQALHPLDVAGKPFHSRRNPVLNSMSWHARFFSLKEFREPGAVVFSPGSGWGFNAPPRLALTWHDCINRHFPVYMGRRMVRRWYMRQAEQYLHRARVIFTESHHAAQDIATLLKVPEERLAVIPAWLPPEYNLESARATISAVRAKYHLPERYWLYVGGFDVRKNVEFLIHSYAEASRHTPCPPLVLAGRIPTIKGPTFCDVAGAKRAANLIPQTLIEPGFIADSDLPGLYAGAELFIYPSLIEGYGLPPMEAMGCGCPAIVADNSSLREVVTDESCRFSTDNTAQLVDLLLNAAKNPRPLNPSFNRSRHDEAAAISMYLKALTDMGAT